MAGTLWRFAWDASAGPSAGTEVRWRGEFSAGGYGAVPFTSAACFGAAKRDEIRSFDYGVSAGFNI